MSIRPVRKTDIPALERMLASCGAFSDEEVRVAVEMIECGLGGDYRLLAAETQGDLEGYVCFGQASLTEASWYLYWICVRREAQGSGVGRHLQAAVEADIRARGGTCLVVETSGRADYGRTRRFYRQAGYVEAGRIAGFYRPGDDCVILSKALEPAA